MSEDRAAGPQPACCPQCGAIGCKEKYGDILALEFESPAVFGAVHHLTVLCYNIQHPCFFSDAALAWMLSSLHAIVEEGLSGPDLLKHARNAFSGDAPIKRHTVPANASSGMKWSMTVTDIRTEDPETYVADIKAWAQSILNDLGETG